MPRGAGKRRARRSQSIREVFMARTRKVPLVVAALAAAAVSAISTQGALAGSGPSPGSNAPQSTAPASRSAAALASTTATPIKHVVVIFQENVSFDHYFGTYPNAANSAGEPSFRAAPGTPSVNGLAGPSADQQSEPVEPATPRSVAGGHVRPGSRLHRRAERVRPRADGPVCAEDGRRSHPSAMPGLGPGHAEQLRGDGLLRRQHRHRAVELRPALRDERQLVRG